MIPAADRFGPWAVDLDHAERLARLRAMRAIVRLSTGARGERFADLLAQAERGPAALAPAAAEMGRLAATDRRHVLASFAAVHRPN